MSLPIYAGCSTGFGEGGLGGHLSFICRAARSDGRDVRVFCRGKPAYSALEFESVPFPVWSRWLKYSPLRWSTARQTRWFGSQFDRHAASMLPDRPVVYHSFPGFAEHSFRKVKEGGGVTVLEAATTHAEHVFAVTEEEHRRYRMGGNPFSFAWVQKVLREYELADYITVASELQRNTFLERGVPSGKLLYAPLGVDTSWFCPAGPFGRPRQANQSFRIIQVGQISLRKGFLYLLEAVRLLKDPRIEVLLVGGIGRRGIRHAIDRYREEGLNIRQFSGDPLTHLREAHLYVHSSVEDGFGLAPLEAMAAGLPVIVTEQTGMKDLIEDGTDGLIVPSRDTERLAEAISRFLEDDETRLKMGRRAVLKANHYDAGSCSMRYAEALRPIWAADLGGKKLERSRV